MWSGMLLTSLGGSHQPLGTAPVVSPGPVGPDTQERQAVKAPAPAPPAQLLASVVGCPRPLSAVHCALLTQPLKKRIFRISLGLENAVFSWFLSPLSHSALHLCWCEGSASLYCGPRRPLPVLLHPPSPHTLGEHSGEILTGWGSAECGWALHPGHWEEEDGPCEGVTLPPGRPVQRVWGDVFPLCTVLPWRAGHWSPKGNGHGRQAGAGGRSSPVRGSPRQRASGGVRQQVRLSGLTPRRLCEPAWVPCIRQQRCPRGRCGCQRGP